MFFTNEEKKLHTVLLNSLLNGSVNCFAEFPTEFLRKSTTMLFVTLLLCWSSITNASIIASDNNLENASQLLNELISSDGLVVK